MKIDMQVPLVQWINWIIF